MWKLKGFSLVEIMIVMAIIVLLAAIAIPNLLRARVNANEAAAVAALQTISGAAQSYRSSNPTYPTILQSLSTGNVPYIDNVLGCATAPCGKQGYSFELTQTDAGQSFTAVARPQAFEKSGVRGFFVDASGVIHFTTLNEVPTATSPVLQ